MPTFVHRDTGKCLTRTGTNIDTWDGYKLRDCGGSNQETQYNTDGGLVTGDKHMVITPQNLLMGQPANDVRAGEVYHRAGFGKDGFFEIEGLSGASGSTAINSGLFRIKNRFHSNTRLDHNGDTVVNIPVSSGTSQQWIELGLLRKCEARDIPIAECSTETLKDCVKYGSKADFNACPENYCSRNVEKPECQTWCRANPGKCDNAMKTYCDTNMSSEICGCYNTDYYSEIKDAITKKGGTFKIGCLETCSRPGVFKPLEAINPQCPKQTLCIQSASATNTGLGVNISGVTFSCTQNESDSGVASSPTKEVTQTEDVDATSITPAVLIVGVVVLLLLIILLT